jgi:glycosyltransferase 2 family protein
VNQTSLPIKSWFKKGLSLVLVFSIISSGFLFLSSASARNWFHWDKLNYWAILAACLTLLCSWLIEAVRIRLIATGLGDQIAFTKVLGINLATAFTGNVTPFNSGGVPTQIFLLCQNGIQPGKASAIVTIRVILTTLLFTLLSPLLLAFFYTKFPFGLVHQITTIAIPLACLVSVFLIAFIIKPKLARYLVASLIKCLKSSKLGVKIQPLLAKALSELEVFNESIRTFRKGLNFYLVILYTILYWTLFFSIAPLLMYAFNFNATDVFVESIIFQFVLVFIIAYLPIPGGSGIMELSLFSVFIFIPLHVRAIFILAWRFLSYYLSTIVGGIVLLRIVNRPSDPAAELPN